MALQLAHLRGGFGGSERGGGEMLGDPQGYAIAAVLLQSYARTWQSLKMMSSKAWDGRPCLHMTFIPWSMEDCDTCAPAAGALTGGARVSTATR